MIVDTVQDSLFFVLSKVGWVLISPTNLIIIALCLSAIFLLINQVSAAKKLLIPTALISFSIMLYPVGDFLMEPLESRFKVPESFPSNIDGIIILGGGEDLERSLSWNVAELGSGGDRYIGAADLANLYPDTPVIFTGGSGLIRVQDSKGEGSIARKLLTSVGIESERLIIESNSRNTYENFKYTKPLLPKYYKGKTTGTYLLVTSAFHMPRAVGIARKQGIKVIAYPVDYYSNHEDRRHFELSMIEHLKVLEKAWREWIGLTAYFMTDKIDHWFPTQVINTSNLNVSVAKASSHYETTTDTKLSAPQ